MDTKKVVQILFKIAEKLEAKKDYLSELDGAIGDGDHGLNMNRGFNAAIKTLDSSKDISDAFKKTAMQLIKNVGGASGPLYGTAFLECSKKANNIENIKIEDFLNILKGALDGIKFRGKATLGEKTIIDALEPAINSMAQAIEGKESTIEVLKKGKEAAYAGVMHTKDIIATKGRASYLGERSIGHQDPGATSCYYILETIYEEVLKDTNA